MSDHKAELLRIAREARDKREQAAVDGINAGRDDERFGRAELLQALVHLEMVNCLRILRTLGLHAKIGRDVNWELGCDGRKVTSRGPSSRDPNVTLEFNGTSSAKRTEWKATDENVDDDLVKLAQSYAADMITYLSGT